MKNKIISVTAMAIIAACLMGCASDKPVEQNTSESRNRERAREIVTKSVYVPAYPDYDVLNAR